LLITVADSAESAVASDDVARVRLRTKSQQQQQQQQQLVSLAA